MDSGKTLPLRALPRIFVDGLDAEQDQVALPKADYDKLHRVLRLGNGDQIAVLPNDGTILRCELVGHNANILARETLDTEPNRTVILAQALLKADKLDDVIRSATEIGVAGFILFPSDRTVVKWDQNKIQEKTRRLEAISREGAELSFRARLPFLHWAQDLESVLAQSPDASVLSESEQVERSFTGGGSESTTIVIGPEGGWSPREIQRIGPHACTLGPRVLHAEAAAIAACALALLGGR